MNNRRKGQHRLDTAVVVDDGCSAAGSTTIPPPNRPAACTRMVERSSAISDEEDAVPDALERRLTALEQRVSRQEHREVWMLKLLCNEPMAPFAHFVLENDLDAEQIKGLEDAMEAAHNKLVQVESLDALDFEKQLLPHIPPAEKPHGLGYSFVQRLLTTYARTGQWQDVVEHFRLDFNVPRQEKLQW